MFLSQIEERWKWIYGLQTEVYQANTLWLWGNKKASRLHQPFVSAGSSENFASAPPLMLVCRQRVRFPPGLLKPFCLPWIPSAEAAEPLAAPKTSIVNQPRVINDFRHGSSAQPCLQARKENWIQERVCRGRNDRNYLEMERFAFTHRPLVASEPSADVSRDVTQTKNNHQKAFYVI